MHRFFDNVLVSKDIQKDLKADRKSKSAPKLVVGEIYADWCGHCTTLQPKWEIFDKKIKQRFNKTNQPLIYKVEETDMDDPSVGLETLRVHLADPTEKVAVQDGYPTIFKIVNGVLSYYNGQREVGPMIAWSMQGIKTPPKTSKHARKHKTRRNKTNKKHNKKYH